MYSKISVGLAVSFIILSGCGSVTTESSCTPGMVISCPCSSVNGTQICLLDRTYSACSCRVPSIDVPFGTDVPLLDINMRDVEVIVDAGLADSGSIDVSSDAVFPSDTSSRCPVDMVLVPAGTFLMGDMMDPMAQPVHGVRISAFCMHLTEVTVAAYARCSSPGCTTPNTGGSCNQGVVGRELHPVNCVEWGQSKAYCQWIGGDLPTESQWEYAARGSDGRIYPWGSDAPSNQLCWSGATSRTSTCPVQSFSQGNSPFGLYDMSGNVWEWVRDWYGPYMGDTMSYAINPAGPSRGTFGVYRGGSWFDPTTNYMRTSLRRNDFMPSARSSGLGFRCMREPM